MNGSAADRELRPSIDLIVVQPTTFCNISCDYCYLPYRNLKRRMRPDTLRALAECVARSPLVGKTIEVVWHGGEPLVLPADWYDAAFRTFRDIVPADVSIRHGFQTNGTLLQPKWCEFFRKWECQIGMSIDGPPQIHDARRKSRSGHPTHKRVMHGMSLLRQAGIDPHVITVLTFDSLAQPDALIDFYLENGVTCVGFNIEEIEGANKTCSLAGKGAEILFRRFLRRVLARIHELPPGTLRIREFCDAARALDSKPPVMTVNSQTLPFSIISIDVDGNISTFSPELLGSGAMEYDDFVFGNVHDVDLEDIALSAAFRKAYAHILCGVRACARTCNYFGACGGGTPANKYFENGDLKSTETLFCRLHRKAVLDVFGEHFPHGLCRSAPVFGRR